MGRALAVDYDGRMPFIAAIPWTEVTTGLVVLAVVWFLASRGRS